MTQADELRRVADLNETGRALRIAIVVGFGFVVLRYFFAFVSNGWKGTSGIMCIALTWSLAWFATAFVFGFLFGIPKVPKVAANDPQKDGLPAGTNTTRGENQAQDVPYQLRVNTNLEEISDWLTKVLVGATLTQLFKIPTKIGDAARFMAEGTGGIGSTTFAAAILIYFSALGFFAGYVLTRMFFAGAFVRSDAQLSIRDIGKLQGARISLDPSAPPDADTVQSAENSRAIAISNSLPPGVAAAVAKGAIIMGDVSRAIQAARLAVDNSPADPRAHLNYAIALQRSNADSSLVKSELEKARALVTASLDAATVEDIYNSIMYFYLYRPEPEGFTKAIEYGEEYLQTHIPSGPSIWINLAAAYGQQYGFLRSPQAAPVGTPDQLNQAKANAMLAVKSAIRISSTAVARFRELATGIPDPEDDDLAVFANDAQFRALIGLD